MKYTSGKAIVTQRDILTHINKKSIIIIVRPVCRKFDTKVPYILSISFDLEYVSKILTSVFLFFQSSILSFTCSIIFSISAQGVTLTSNDIVFNTFCPDIIYDFCLSDTSSKYTSAISLNLIL
jgi:hypothetical protein